MIDMHRHDVKHISSIAFRCQIYVFILCFIFMSNNVTILVYLIYDHNTEERKCSKKNQVCFCMHYHLPFFCSLVFVKLLADWSPRYALLVVQYSNLNNPRTQVFNR